MKNVSRLVQKRVGHSTGRKVKRGIDTQPHYWLETFHQAKTYMETKDIA